MARRRKSDRQGKRRRLRKQPKRRLRSSAAIPVPQVDVPRTARRRRRRNTWRTRLPLGAIRRFVFSARWISLGLLALVVYAVYLIGMDVGFYLTHIPVEGTFSIPPAEIVQASDLAGAHIFAANPSVAAAKITELPGVISSTVTVEWPNEVLIRIKEDTPIAVWREGDTDYWVTKDGRLLPARTSSLGLLVIESEMPLPPTPTPVADAEDEGAGTEAAAPEPGLPFVPKEVLVGALQLRDLRPNISQLYYESSGGLSYLDGRGWRAYFGAGANMEQRLVVYETIVEELLARGLTPEYISVSNPEKPYYKVQ